MLRYLLEIILFQAIFLGVYQIFFRRETFFKWNRGYLLTTMLVSLLLPFAQFSVFQSQVKLPQQFEQLAPVLLNNSNSAPVLQTPTNEPEINWWLVVYGIGLIFSLGILFRKYQEVRRYYRFRKKETPNLILIPNSTDAFTFLSTIFIGEKIDLETREHILAHEQVHVAQYHGLDLLFFEVLRVIFWFNPLVYGYQQRICEVHEYLADAKATKSIKPKTYYNQLLNTAFGTRQISFTNTFFNHSLIKKRIIMLQKHSKNTAKWKYLLLIPVLAGMLTYVGCSSDNSAQGDQSQSIEQQISDLQAQIEAKGELSKEETALLKNLIAASKDKSNLEEEKEENVMLNETLIENVPYAVVEEVPTFSGCEELTDNKARKECTSNQLTRFVQKNFDTSLGKKLGLTGINKVYVQFKIKANGEVEFMGSRGPRPELEIEAERVIGLLPDMKPGLQRGKPVDVTYALPIVFNVAK